MEAKRWHDAQVNESNPHIVDIRIDHEKGNDQ
jgi:hypothetical protein